MVSLLWILWKDITIALHTSSRHSSSTVGWLDSCKCSDKRSSEPTTHRWTSTLAAHDNNYRVVLYICTRGSSGLHHDLCFNSSSLATPLTRASQMQQRCILFRPVEQTSIDMCFARRGLVFYFFVRTMCFTLMCNVDVGEALHLSF